MENLPTYNDLWVYTKKEYSCGDYDRDDPLVCNSQGTCEDTTICSCNSAYEGSYCETEKIANDSWRAVVLIVVPVSFVAIVVLAILVIGFSCLIAISYKKKIQKLGGGKKGENVSVNQSVKNYGGVDEDEDEIVLIKDEDDDLPVPVKQNVVNSTVEKKTIKENIPKKEEENDENENEEKEKVEKKKVLFKKKTIEKE